MSWATFATQLSTHINIRLLQLYSNFGVKITSLSIWYGLKKKDLFHIEVYQIIAIISQYLNKPL